MAKYLLLIRYVHSLISFNSNLSEYQKHCLFVKVGIHIYARRTCRADLYIIHIFYWMMVWNNVYFMLHYHIFWTSFCVLIFCCWLFLSISMNIVFILSVSQIISIVGWVIRLQLAITKIVCKVNWTDEKWKL